VNGRVLSTALRVPGRSFKIGPQTLGECEQQRTELTESIAAGHLVVSDDSSLLSSTFAQLLTDHNLGMGETECLAFCLGDSEMAFCSDDKRARGVARLLFGEIRVTGTISLLRECVRCGTLSSTDAKNSYEEMRACGGFLPTLPESYFECGSE